MVNHKSVAVVFAALILAVLTAASTYALGGSPRENFLAFSRSVALPGVVLGAGTYSFEVLEPGVGIDVVRVSSRDHRRVFYTGITLSEERPQGMDQTQLVTFGEAARGEAPPIKAWYPIDSSMGRRFIYSGR